MSRHDVSRTSSGSPSGQQGHEVPNMRIREHSDLFFCQRRYLGIRKLAGEFIA
jgi:hypothetical protein